MANVVFVPLLFVLLLTVAPTPSHATHFRYMTANWERTSTTSTKITVFIEQGWRASYFGVTEGQQGVRASTMLWGDGSYQTIALDVVTLNSEQDWFIGTATMEHTYSSLGTYTFSISSCCRISTLRDGNNDDDFIVKTTLDLSSSLGDLASTRVTGVPIVTFYKDSPGSFVIPAQAEADRSLEFVVTQSRSDSGLTKASPNGMALSSTSGRIDWTPAIDGLYALQVQIYSNTASESRVAMVTMDFILEVLDAPPPSNVIPSEPTLDVSIPVTAFIGSEVAFDVTGVDTGGDNVIVTSGTIPPGSSLASCAEGTSSNGFSVSNTCTRRFRWTPQLGQKTVDVLFFTTDDTGLDSSVLRVTIQIGAAQTLYLSGIVRDFESSHPDFGRANGDSGTSLVENTLSVAGKPDYKPSGATSTVSGKSSFDQWFVTTDGVNTETVHSITLSNLNDPLVFKFDSTNFRPIGADNDYFTYEINSFVTYRGGEIFEFVSSDDLWLYIDGRLVIDLGGIHAPASGSVALNALGLTVNSTYSFDLFFAHRGSGSTPTLQVETSEAAVCNVVSSGVTSLNFASFSSSSGFQLNGNAAYSFGALRIAASTDQFFSASAWYPTPQRILNGFVAEFMFEVDLASSGNVPEGFAFVFHRQDIYAGTGAGSNLGYGSIQNSVAVEFDFHVDAELADPVGNGNGHVSVHTRYEQGNNAHEDYSRASQALAADVILTDGAAHRVVITYVPAPFDADDASLLGWLRVYIDGNVVPAVSAQLDDNLVRDMLNGAAFVGFTGSSGDSDTLANVDITSFQLSVVPPSEEWTSELAQPSAFKAGTTGSMQIQARDACRNDIQLGGDGDRFRVLMEHSSGLVYSDATVLDLDNGQYTIQYAPTKAGVWTIDVQFDTDLSPTSETWASIRGSPWQASVFAGDTSEAFSTFTYDSSAGAGDTGTITIRARDAYDNPKTSGSEASKFTTEFSPALTLGSIVDVGDGSYTRTFSAQNSREYQLYVKYEGRDIVGSPTTLTVSPGAASAAQSSVGGQAIFSATADGSATVFVSLFDAFGNAVNTDANGDVVTCTVVRDDGSATATSSVSFNSVTGNFDCSYHATVAGTYNLTVTVNGEDVPGSYQPLVSPGVVSADQSYIVTPINSGDAVVAGALITVYVQTRDQYGNERSVSAAAGDAFRVNVNNGAALVDSTVLNANMAFDGSGRYRISYRARTAGASAHIISALYLPSSGSPSFVNDSMSVPVDVAAGAASASASELSVGAVSLAAGDTFTFTVVAKDQYNNPRADENDASLFTVSMLRTSPADSATGLVQSITATAQDAEYSGGVIPRLVGTYDVNVQLLGENVGGSSATEVTVTPGATDPDTCSVGGDTQGGLGGSTHVFTVQARDEFSNLQTSDADVFRVTLQQVGAGDTQATVSPVGGNSGKHEVNYTVPSLRADGSCGQADCNGFTMVVELQDADTPTTYHLVETLTARVVETQAEDSAAFATGTDGDFAAGVTHSFTVQDRQPDGTLVTSGGGNFRVPVVHADDGDDVSVGVTDNSDGTYTVRFQPFKDGTYHVNIFWQLIVESNVTAAAPYSINVVPGALGGSQSQLSGDLPASNVVAGDERFFNISLFDQWDNPYTAPAAGYTVKLTLIPENDDIAPFDTDGGTYLFSYNFTETGAKLMQLRAVPDGGGSAVSLGTDDTYLVTVVAAAVHAPSCEATSAPFPAIDGLRTGVAGETSSLFVTLKDFYGNSVDDDSATVTAALSVDTGVDSEAEYVGDGRYRVTYVPETAGAQTLAITVGGASDHIAGSPVTLDDIEPAEIDGAATDISGLDVTGSVGVEFSFTVVPRDRFDNELSNVALTITFEGSGDARGESGTVSVSSSVGSATYTCTFTPQRSGNYSLTFRTPDGVVELDDNTGVVVGAGVADATQSTVTQPSDGVAGVMQSIFVDVHDALGNARTQGGDTVTLAFVSGVAQCGKILNPDPANDTLVDAPDLVYTTDTFVVQDSSDAQTYNLTFGTEKAGVYSLEVLVNGATAWPDCNQFPKFVIRPAAADPSRTVLSGDFLDDGFVAGETTTLQVQVYDEFDNQRTTGVDTVALGETPAGSPAGLPAASTWISNANAASIGAQVSTARAVSGAYEVNFEATKAGTYALVVTVNGEATAAFPTVDCNAAGVATIETPTLPTVTAALAAEFTLAARDEFGNLVTTTVHTFSADLKRDTNDGLGRYELAATVSESEAVVGQHEAAFTSHWHGNYDVVLVVEDPTNPLLVNNSVELSLDVLHATCGYASPNSPLRCPHDRTCVSTYSSCNVQGVPRCSHTEFACPGSGACTSDLATCACPAGGFRCPAGEKHCVKDPAECPSASVPPVCPSHAPHRCASSSVCRASASDCPSPRVCPPGLYLCADGASCARSEAECVLYFNRSSECPDAEHGSQVRCPDGTCVRFATDCPTPITCSPKVALTRVVCPDGSCQDGAQVCPPLYDCPDGWVRCRDSATCQRDVADCPTQPTCPIGWVRCESGECASAVSECSEPTSCAYNTTRCPDGTCKDNLLLCASSVTCPSGSPVRCWDGSCATTLTSCPATVSSWGTVRCPNGGWATSEDACLTGTTCPASAPVRCPNGECTTSMSECLNSECTRAPLLVRCADGTCASAAKNCPSFTACPAALPVRCPDGRCASASDQCVAVSEIECPTDYVRCPDGSCASHRAHCSTPTTCPEGTTRCSDGICLPECTEVTDASKLVDAVRCADGQVMCPRTVYGVQCVDDFSLCPTQPVCPVDAPVRCQDATCQARVEDCPEVPETSDVIGRASIYCADGAFESNADRCGTTTGCPASAPFKCWDMTCRRAPHDCPSYRVCPRSTPHLCASSGVCVLRMDDCRSGKTCATPGQVLCANQECVDDPADCADLTTPLSSDNSAFASNLCPTPGHVRCRNGMCVQRPSFCSEVECPTHLPHRCSDGMCAPAAGMCNDETTGCPWYATYRCWDGTCAAEESQCTNNTLIDQPCSDSREQRCWDGVNCVELESDCPERSGCPPGEFRCWDGTCVDVDRKDDCTTSESEREGYHNACPPSNPVQCSDGFCAKTHAHCTRFAQRSTSSNVVNASAPCPAERPVLCAAGQCVLSSAQCPAVPPCNIWNDNEQRCPDGSCRSLLECNAESTCPDGYERCDNGRCVPEVSGGSLCPTDSGSGCPSPLVRCAGTGMCVNVVDLSSCEDPVLGNGCATQGHVKCSDGSCVADEAQCPVANGCPAATPYRCLNGQCVADATACTAAMCPSTSVKCPNGDCVSSYALCKTRSGCPVATPVRCADGSCRQLPAMTLSASSPASLRAMTCPATPVCTGLTPYQCADGSCVEHWDFCRSVVGCPDDEVMCSDLTCAASADECALDAKNLCPAATPFRCSSGLCVSSGTLCEEEEDECDDEAPVRCFDGSCATTYYACVERAHVGRGYDTAVLSMNANVQNVTCLNETTPVLCPDGSCVPTEAFCSLVGACPTAKPYRCADGSCANATSSCMTVGDCPLGLSRCADGLCRVECLPYDGCPAETPYQCGPAECTANADACDVETDPTEERKEWSWATLSTTTTRVPVGSSLPCASDCARDLRPAFAEFTVNAATNPDDAVLDIAADDTGFVRTRVVIPAGSLVPSAYGVTSTDATATVTIAPVAASVLRDAVNRVHVTREVEYAETLTFAQTVVSTPFRCTVDAGLTTPFPVPLTVEATVDSLYGTPQDDEDDLTNVCLAKLTDAGLWDCVAGNSREQRVADPAWDEEWNLLPSRVRSVLSECSSSGTTLAFILSPLPKASTGDGSTSTAGEGWAEKNWGIVLGICIAVGVLMVMGSYGGSRLYRYRGKYKAQRAKAEELEDTMKDIEIVGSQATTMHDDDTIFVANPLVRRQAEIEGRLQNNAVHLKRRESGLMKREDVSNLEDERDQLQAELARLKAQLAMQQGGGEGSAAAAAAPGAAAAPAPSSSTGPGEGAPLQQQVSSSSSMPQQMVQEEVRDEPVRVEPDAPVRQEFASGGRRQRKKTHF